MYSDDIYAMLRAEIRNELVTEILVAIQKEKDERDNAITEAKRKYYEEKHTEEPIEREVRRAYRDYTDELAAYFQTNTCKKIVESFYEKSC